MNKNEPDSIRFSLIIPAYNEEAFLPHLLKTVEKARINYPGGAKKIEVMVADNSSTDATAEIARLHGCRVVKVEKRAIAAARNGGARDRRALPAGHHPLIRSLPRLSPSIESALGKAASLGR